VQNSGNNLRKKMGAELIQWTIESQWTKFNPEEWQRLQREGIDVPIENVVPAEDGTLEYRGQKVVLYIRDQHISSRYDTSGSGYRFHIADCRKLKEMREKGKFDRYVVANRKDGKFIVNRFEYNKLLEEQIEVEIPVCKLCLTALNYDNYKHSIRDQKDEIWSSFNLIDYFEKYSSKISKVPRYTTDNAPLNVYPDNIDEISRIYKMSMNWQCEDCRIDLQNNKRFLHLHHIDSNKYNNNTSNLRALCIKCHANQPDHDHLRNSPDYIRFTLWSLRQNL